LRALLTFFLKLTETLFKRRGLFSPMLLGGSLLLIGGLNPASQFVTFTFAGGERLLELSDGVRALGQFGVLFFNRRGRVLGLVSTSFGFCACCRRLLLCLGFPLLEVFEGIYCQVSHGSNA
jgi:hypothetical protein